MKYTKYILTVAILFAGYLVNGQAFNWSTSKEQKHIINLNLSSEYAVNYGVSYHFKLRSKLPIILNAEYSFPSGENITDDFKTKMGGQIDWVQLGNFHFISKIHGVFRRYQNDNARLLNFGSDLSGTIGYYRSKWFIAGEIGFDKAIVTHFKHSDFFKSNYPGVKDGWYEPATGGNFYFGIQAGISRKKFDVYLKAGKLVEQDFKTLPMLPIYGQLGVNFKFR